MATQQFPPPPVFGLPTSSEQIRNGPTTLVDIFDDFLFANSTSANVDGNSMAYSGSNELDEEDDFDDDDEEGSQGDSDDGRKRTRPRSSHRSMTEEQRVERR
jgi:hypothetical protein